MRHGLLRFAALNNHQSAMAHEGTGTAVCEACGFDGEDLHDVYWRALPQGIDPLDMPLVFHLHCLQKLRLTVRAAMTAQK